VRKALHQLERIIEASAGDLVRISAGIEECEDIIHNLRLAMVKV